METYCQVSINNIAYNSLIIKGFFDLILEMGVKVQPSPDSFPTGIG